MTTTTGTISGGWRAITLPRRWARADEQRRFILAASTFLPVSLIGFGVTSLFVSFAWLDPFGRKSPRSLYSLAHVTFEADKGAYNQRDDLRPTTRTWPL